MSQRLITAVALMFAMVGGFLEFMFKKGKERTLARCLGNACEQSSTEASSIDAVASHGWTAC